MSLRKKWTDIVPYREAEWPSWWQYVRCHPRAAQDHPLWGLMLLAEPERWLELEGECLGNWIRFYADKLRIEDARQWACDCVAHALPLLGDSRRNPAIRVDMERIIEEIRCQTMEQPENSISQPQSWAWRKHIFEKLKYMKNLPRADELAVCLYDGLKIISDPEIFHRQYAEPSSVIVATLECLSEDDRGMQEARWQWRQLQKYLPPYAIQRHPI